MNYFVGACWCSSVVEKLNSKCPNVSHMPMYFLLWPDPQLSFVSDWCVPVAAVTRRINAFSSRTRLDTGETPGRRIVHRPPRIRTALDTLGLPNPLMSWMNLQSQLLLARGVDRELLQNRTWIMKIMILFPSAVRTAGIIEIHWKSSATL